MVEKVEFAIKKFYNYFVMDIIKYFADFLTTSFGLELNSKLGITISFFIEDTIKIFLLIYIMLFIVSLFRKQLSPEKVRQYLKGKSSWWGYILAVFLGTVTPFCSCSSIPLFIAFLAVGIPFGITMAFLISSPLISEVATVLLLITPNAGLKAALAYILIGAIISVLGGYMCDKFHLKHLRIKKANDEECHNCDGKHCHGAHKHEHKDECQHIHEDSCHCHHHTHNEDSTIAYAYNYANSTVKEIWIYVLIGLAVGAFMHGYIPEDTFVKYLGAENPFAVIVAAIAGIPIYANHDSVLPIIQVLLMKNVPLGTTLVMLMSITSISLPEMIMLNKVLSWKMLGIFVSYLFISFIIVGYLMNFIL